VGAILFEGEGPMLRFAWCAARAGASLLLAGSLAPRAGGLDCDPAGAGLKLPEGFCALVVGEDLGRVRNLAVAPNGDLFAALRAEDSGVLALRDADGDGRAEIQRRFGPAGGHGIALTATHLYFGQDDRVLRWPWRPGQLEPEGEAETVARGLGTNQEHEATALALGPEGTLYASIGAPSNSCQQQNRAPKSPGQDPCPQLADHAGVWRFAADGRNQEPTSETRFATGMRNALALAVEPGSGALYAVVHGRDLLGANWGYSDERNAELPAEELLQVHRGDDLGWPYCYYDGLARKKVLAPEYGGDGTQVGRCADKRQPDLAFPAHWAPMAIAFYTGDQFPERYQGGAFVAFRGSWNRAPLPQEGYRVAFAPFRGGAPAGGIETFAIGAADPTSVRVTGVAVGPEGSLFVADEKGARIWRVMFRAPR
jgi:glucose/arabinose dehydrogenase